MMRVAYLGCPGSYSHSATTQLFPGPSSSPIGYESFDAVVHATDIGDCQFAVLPLENSLGGSIHVNFDALLRNPNIFIVGETHLKIQHCLMILPENDPNDISTVLSHPQALAQCGSFIKKCKYTTEDCSDTAGCARRLSTRNPADKHCAAIASAQAAEIYGLKIVKEGIADEKTNVTRFVVLSKNPTVPQATVPCKTSLLFSLNDQAGSLFKALSVFALRDISLAKIENRPGRNELFEKATEYDNLCKIVSPLTMLNKELISIIQTSQRQATEKPTSLVVFYFDVLSSLSDIRTFQALRNLAEISPFIRVLGCYPVDGVCLENDTKEVIFYPRWKSVHMKIGVIGFGRFGQFFVGRLLQDGHQVFAINIRDGEDFSREAIRTGLEINETYFQGRQHFAKFFESVDIVVLAVSILSFESVLTSILPHLKSHLLIDVLSVKQHARDLLVARVPPSCDILCTHPMFGPDSGKGSWVGLPLVYEKISIKDVHRCARFLSFFEDKGCKMVQMTCEEHDRIASSTQFITHLTARVLSMLNLQDCEIATKGFQVLKELVENANRDSFDLFYALFKHNQFSSDQLRALESALASVKASLLERDRSTTDPIVRPLFSPRIESLEASKTGKMTDLSKKTEK